MRYSAPGCKAPMHGGTGAREFRENNPEYPQYKLQTNYLSHSSFLERESF
jgi:hypothetical protein